jgi:hypothetical protein
LEKANDVWENQEIIGIGNEFIELSEINSTSMNTDTREILANFGYTIKDIGIKLENLRIKLNSWSDRVFTFWFFHIKKRKSWDWESNMLLCLFFPRCCSIHFAILFFLY